MDSHADGQAPDPSARAPDASVRAREASVRAPDASARAPDSQALHGSAASRATLAHEQELVDEAAAESFPASDAPSYSAMHAGAPAPRPWAAEHGHEMRAHLRADLQRLAMRRSPAASPVSLEVDPRLLPEHERPLPEHERRLAERERLLPEHERPLPEHERQLAEREEEEIVARAMLEADRVVVREPMSEAGRVRTVESELVGADRHAPCVVLYVRYDRDDARIATFLAVVRAMAASRPRRSVRFVAVADAPSISARSYYAARLRSEGTSVHAVLSIGTLALSRERPGCVFFTSDFERRLLARIAGRAFRTASRIPARTLWVPGSMARAIGDADLREAHRLGRTGAGVSWPVVTISDRSPWALRRWALWREAPADVDRIVATVPGIAAVVECLAK